MKLKTAIILVMFLAVFLLGNMAQAGLGLSPSDWLEKNALRGSRIEKIFTLSRSEPEEDLYFTAEITGELKDWLKIDKGLEFTMPKGAQQFPIKVTLDIPKNADFKNYQTEIRLKSGSKSKETSGMGSSVILNALIRIDLTVSQKEFSDYDVLQIIIPKQEEGNNINVVLKIWNRGNIEAKPTKLTIDFFDKYKQGKIDSQELTDFSHIKAVAPFSEGEIKLEIPAKFAKEQYWATAKVYQNEKILKAEDIFFEVVEKGSLKKGIVNLGNGLIKYILIGLVIILLGVGTWWKIKRRKNQV